MSLTSSGCTHAATEGRGLQEIGGNYGRLRLKLRLRRDTSIAEIHSWGSFNPTSHQVLILLTNTARIFWAWPPLAVHIQLEGEDYKKLKETVGGWDWDWDEGVYRNCWDSLLRSFNPTSHQLSQLLTITARIVQAWPSSGCTHAATEGRRLNWRKLLEIGDFYCVLLLSGYEEGKKTWWWSQPLGRVWPQPHVQQLARIRTYLPNLGQTSVVAVQANRLSPCQPFPLRLHVSHRSRGRAMSICHCSHLPLPPSSCPQICPQIRFLTQNG